MSAVEKAALSRDEARSLTDEVKGDAERLWRKLVELYEGGAHLALGYSSWGAYFKTEFGGSRATAYRMLDAGRVARELEQVSVSHVRLNARQAEQLAPLKNDPGALREAWAEVVELHPEPTAADVREVVEARRPTLSGKAEMNANAAKRRLGSALAAIDGYRIAFADFRFDRAFAVATSDDLAEWERQLRDAITELNRIRRMLKEVSA